MRKDAFDPLPTKDGTERRKRAGTYIYEIQRAIGVVVERRELEQPKVNLHQLHHQQMALLQSSLQCHLHHGSPRSDVALFL